MFVISNNHCNHSFSHGHTTPCDDAASVIVPPALRERLVARRISTVGIHKKIRHALEGFAKSDNIHPDTDPSYDWEEAKGRIAEIIREYETIVASPQ